MLLLPPFRKHKFVRLKGPEFPLPQNGLVENGLVVRQIFKKSLNYFHNIAILSPHRKDMALYLKKLEFSSFYPGSFVPIYDEIGVVVQKKTGNINGQTVGRTDKNLA